MNYQELLEDYHKKKSEIKGRLKEFRKTFKQPDEIIFQELVFCILTANASAQMGINSVNEIKNVLLEGSVNDLRKGLKGRHRFWKVRAQYIFHTREYLKENFNFRIKEKIYSFKDRNLLRDFFASNKDIKGLGYKEASHFLRNIGFKGYAIIDKHILNCLYEFRQINKPERPKNKKQYIEIENAMRSFSERVKIDMDEMDLLLWSRKTGKILK
ncbi:MAG: hypothetical protein A2043_00625 [Candidatus Schekmanbacteria bacterium GWA2_38_9]|uniref:8-oxoguanine DNA glycosylase/AP lyase n=1 Tax=Candidatus Schekmanbacteria bacterium RIFCSPLOWO2_12_FULL_38_15 TaxID=1817883 RepID=A0A1F7SJL2_9BACT|nr:MAG: hypothetical protein A2043_00625 [Candidatus Schekmanbacteria bacterium GWA2_38_9]OGL50853.1 MAG: hypothetical protein A3H37_03315 [Candidatus Schekmanbacteria bacterium RIFCSPLOWO2_02_FULL_38_14]OGL53387.1 MAG: hypothetical protein A3G31_07750 [Candidatus Schekmanbacteria bacterium RIFCSPLOWO2_12_FULL_38_15]